MHAITLCIGLALACCGPDRQCIETALEDSPRGAGCTRTDPEDLACDSGLDCAVVCLCGDCGVTELHGSCSTPTGQTGSCESAQLICDFDCKDLGGWTGDFCFVPE